MYHCKDWSLINSLSVSAIITLIDQNTKILVKNAIDLSQTVPVIDNLFYVTNIENPGIIFGFSFFSPFLLIIISLTTSLLLFYYSFKIRNLPVPFLVHFSLAMILGGACGNLLDRILYGKVTDFIQLTFISVRFPVFNLADFAIILGIGLFTTMFALKKIRIRIRSDN